MNDKISTKTITSAIMFGKNKPLEHSIRKIVSTNDIEFYNRYLDEAFCGCCFYNKDSKIIHRITHFKKILDSQKFLIMSSGSIMLQNPSKFVFKVTL